MSYEVIAIPVFEKELKKLSKKYSSLRAEFITLVKILKAQPVQGTPIGNGCYKIRISIASKGKGKRGGARIISHFKKTGTIIYLLTIYDKSEKEDISDRELSDLLRWIP
jgi:mRNA-degrading endonuclease RelE of RelBE toxin-antitoxin system